MKLPMLLLLLSLAAALGFFVLWGPAAGMPILLSLLIAVWALIRLATAPLRARSEPRWIVVDGSNVMYWDGDRPSLMTVRYVLKAILEEGFVPLVWFDANVGYLTAGQYLRPNQLSRMLGLNASQVAVAPKGTPADPLLLEAAVRIGSRVVTNDRFRDWSDDYPVVQDPGFLVGGWMRDGEVTLGLGERLREGQEVAA